MSVNVGDPNIIVGGDWWPTCQRVNIVTKSVCVALRCVALRVLSLDRVSSVVRFFCVFELILFLWFSVVAKRDRSSLRPP